MGGERTIKIKFDGEESGLDRAAKASAKDVGAVDKQIARYSETVRRLERDIKATGNARLFKDLNANRRLLKQFETLGTDAGKAVAENASKVVEDEFAHLGDRSGKSMVQHFKTSISALEQEIRKTGNIDLFKDLDKNKSLLKRFEQLGDDAGQGFGAKLIGRAGPLLASLPVSPQALGAGVALAAVLSLPVAAALSGAVLGGVGIGGIVGGVALVKDDPRIATALTGIKQQASVILRDAAQPLVPSVERAVDKAKFKIDELKPAFKNIFSVSGILVDPLVDGALKGIKSAIQGASNAISAARPVVQALGQAFADTGKTLGDFLTSIAKDGPAAADAIRNLSEVINFTLGSALDSVHKLTAGWGLLRQSWAMLHGDTKTMAQYVVDTASAASAQEDAAKAAAENERALSGTTLAMQRYRDEAAGATKATKGQADSLRDLYAASRLVNDQQLTLAESTLAYRSAVDQAKTAVDRKKKVSDAEQGSLLALARSTNTLTGSMEKSGATTKELTKHSNDSRAAFIALAEKMGYTRDQARDLAKKYLAVPENVKTNVAAPGLAKAKSDAAAFLTYANDLNGMRIRVSVETSGFVAPEGAKAFKRWGGVTEHARDGLLKDASIFSPVARGARYGFAEPGTGGEAFIPKYGDMARSLKIWEYVGTEWLHALPKSGGQPAPVSTTAAGGDSAVNVRVDLDGQPFHQATVYTSRSQIRRAEWKAGKR